jgi:hypothetical protein
LCYLQRADEEAAKVYEDFVESFKGDDPGRDGGVKTFVRGGVVAPGSRSHDATGACWRCSNSHKQQPAAARRQRMLSAGALLWRLWNGLTGFGKHPGELLLVGMQQHDWDSVLAVAAFAHCN